MQKKNKYLRKSNKGIFLSERLRDGNFNTGFYQAPAIKNINVLRPYELFIWSMRNKCTNKNKCGLVFYEHDDKFDNYDGIYMVLKYGSKKQIKQLLEELKQFAFVVCPDYSVYCDMARYKQIEAICKSREVGYILSTYGVRVIVNYRASYEWSYELALSGLEKHQIVSIGTLGALRDKKTRTILKNSIDVLVQYIEPSVIIVYGKTPKDVFESAFAKGITIWQYESRISKIFSGGKTNGIKG